MPKRPRIARLRLGDLVIDVYDQDTLFRLLEAFKGENWDKEHKERKSVKKQKSSKAVYEDSVSEDSNLPSFVEGNPWLETLSRRSR